MEKKLDKIIELLEDIKEFLERNEFAVPIYKSDITTSEDIGHWDECNIDDLTYNRNITRKFNY